MGFGVDIRVDADADWRDVAGSGSDGAEFFQLGFALDVEAQDAGFERLQHLSAGFADARKNHLARVAAGGQYALQLAAGDDVKATALLGKKLQYRQR